MISQLERAIAELGLPPEWRISIEIRRRRATLGIEVKAEGTVILAVPEGAKTDEVVEALRGQLERVARAIARRSPADAQNPVKELVDGEHFSYLGRTYRLRITEGPDPDVRLVGDWMRLTIREGGRPEAAQLIDWYTNRGTEWVNSTMPTLARAAGVSAPPTTIQRLRTRWGVRRRDGQVAIHWAVFQLPPPLIELVMAHELTHLRVNKHSADFRRELRKLVPELSLKERLLADVGPSVWLGVVWNSRSSNPEFSD
jgi:predicted metal-dependent hydrolase